jgi:NAD(P)-dependent dehydrogenase (short-subunit alcohol dehydrogenase family)
MKSLTHFHNKKVLITGGTAGLGLALTRNLLQAGAQLAVVARDPEKIGSLRQEFGGSTNLLVIQGDISQKEQIHRIYAEAVTFLTDIDILINNASSIGAAPLRPLLDSTCEDFAEVLETNLLGPYRLTKLVLPSMLLRNSGDVINISSDAPVSAYANWGFYSASKAALDHLSRIWQVELQTTQVRFHAVDPGDMDTALHSAAVPDADRSQLHRPSDSSLLLLNQLITQNSQQVRRSLR